VLYNAAIGGTVTTTLKPIQTQILGTAIVEILNGELTDATVDAVDSIKREDVPEPLSNLVGYMHGMTMQPGLRQDIITSLIEEIRGATEEVLEKRRGKEMPLSTWGLTQGLLFDIFENTHIEDMIEEEIAMLRDVENVEGWTAPLFNHVKSSQARHKELMLELLDVMEGVIQKRRATLR
jgi:hypothetical protein